MGGAEKERHTFLTTAFDGGEWSASRPDHYNPGERTSGGHWIGGWVGPTAGLDIMAIIPSVPLPGIKLRSSNP